MDRSDSEVPKRRPSFRRRLLLTMGSALAVALTVVGVVIWLALYSWLHLNAYTELDVETRIVTSEIVSPGGRLRPSRYSWNEPHHRFAGPHVDPIYLQVFGPDRRLIHQSDNITLIAAGAYPDRLQATEQSERGLIPSLRTFTVAGERLYYIARGIQNQEGEILGYVQVARGDPDIGPLMRFWTVILAIGLLLTLATLILLAWWQAGRVVRPLATITQATESISPNELNRRIPVPAEADRETTQLAETMNDQLERIELAFKEMYRFTSNAAHELQTPLTVLRGHVEVALRRERTPESYQETLSLLDREIDGLTRMVRGLLTLARLDREARTLPGEAVNLVESVRTEVERFETAAKLKGLELKLNLPEEAWVRGQSELLREVVSNLLDNAVKYTFEGYLLAQIDIDGDEVQLTVQDSGIGMASEDSAHATDRFYRAGSADALDVPGSGLGLALVAQIVERHGGSLRIDSAPAKGTCVCIRFPVSHSS